MKSRHIAVVISPSQDYAIFVRTEPHMTSDGLIDPTDEIEEWHRIVADGDRDVFDYADYDFEPEETF